jgi:hypothetical protein
MKLNWNCIRIKIKWCIFTMELIFFWEKFKYQIYASPYLLLSPSLNSKVLNILKLVVTCNFKKLLYIGMLEDHLFLPIRKVQAALWYNVKVLFIETQVECVTKILAKRFHGPAKTSKFHPPMNVWWQAKLDYPTLSCSVGGKVRGQQFMAHNSPPM